MSSLPENPHQLIDAHAHVYGRKFGDDLDAVFHRANVEGVTNVILPATKPDEFLDLVSVAKRYPAASIALGVHPHHASEVTDEDISRLPEQLVEYDAVAVGEIGLDYHYDFSPRDRQIDIFRRQIAIARELSLPFVVHNRESDDDMLKVLTEEQDGTLNFQLHCFSSGREVLERALDLGATVSFTGNITFKKSTLDEVVAAVPDDRFMVETDSPYMTPVPHRGKRNEPSYVREIASAIASIRGVSYEKIASMTTTTAQKFFRLILLLLTIGLFGSTLHAQTEVEPVDEIDTTARTEPFDKLIGVGIHVTGTTFIVDRVTSASTGTLGFQISSSPLLPIGIDQLGVDFIYTPVRVEAVPDALTGAIIDSAGFAGDGYENIHDRIDLFLRYNFKPKAFIDFYASFGYSYMFNSYGVDEVVIEQIGDTVTIGDIYDETLHGVGGGLGLAVNIETPIGLVVPTASWMFSTQLGDRPLERLGDPFQLSHVRLALTIYPPFGELFGLDY